jgi:hypothetical protein
LLSITADLGVKTTERIIEFTSILDVLRCSLCEGTLNLSGSVSIALGGGLAARGGTMNLLPGGALSVRRVTVDDPNTGPGSTVTLNLSYPVTVKELVGTLASPATGTNKAILNLVGATSVSQFSTSVT